MSQKKDRLDRFLDRFGKFLDRLPKWAQLMMLLVGYFIVLTPVALAVIVVGPFMAFGGAFAGMGCK